VRAGVKFPDILSALLAVWRSIEATDRLTCYIREFRDRAFSLHSRRFFTIDCFDKQFVRLQQRSNTQRLPYTHINHWLCLLNVWMQDMHQPVSSTAWPSKQVHSDDTLAHLERVEAWWWIRSGDISSLWWHKGNDSVGSIIAAALASRMEWAFATGTIVVVAVTVAPIDHIQKLYSMFFTDWPTTKQG